MSYNLYDPDEFFVAAIRLTQEQGGKDYNRMLAGARRCLDDFTVPLPSTDFKLMRRDEKSEFLACVEEKFLGTYKRSNVLILPAFPMDDLSIPLYAESYLFLLGDVIEEMDTVIAKFNGPKRVSSRTLNEALKATARLMHYVKHDKVPGYHDFMVKVQSGDKTRGYRRGSAKLLHMMRMELAGEDAGLRMLLRDNYGHDIDLYVHIDKEQ